MAEKIALISEHASPVADPGSVDSGGQNVYVAQVARHLSRQGFEVDVFTRRDRSDLPEILLWEEGVRVVYVPAGPEEYVRKEDLLPFMEDFSNFMIDFTQAQDRPYDLIHANFWMSGLVAARLKRALGIPFIITFHALGRVRRLHQGKDDGFPDVRFAIEEQLIAGADRIVAECPQDSSDLVTLYRANPEKLAIIPCGFDPEEISPEEKLQARQETGLPLHENIVLQLGRMVPRKGVDTTLKGFARMINVHRIPGLLVVVGGESPEPDPVKTPEIGRLMQIAEKEGIRDQVLFTGRRGRDWISRYMSAADVFVSTPWYEPFGITPVEAMSCGTPVIGSNVGGIKYTVEDGVTGYLIPANNAKVLGDRLAHLFRHPELLGNMGKQARMRAVEMFTWERVALLMGQLYRQVIAENNLTTSAAGLGNVSGEASWLVDLSTPVLPDLWQDLPGRSGLPISARIEAIEKGFQAGLETLRRSQVVLGSSIMEAAQAIIDTLSSGGKVLVAGNGGSAADAQHFAAEFVGRFIVDDRKGLPVMALTADSAFLTAWSNDTGYEQVFSRQVETFGQPGDLFVGISTSGRSCNLVAACAAAAERQMRTVALLGSDGGELLRMADIAIVIPSNNGQRIQEVQMLVLHILAEIVEMHFVNTPGFAGNGRAGEPGARDWAWPTAGLAEGSQPGGQGAIRDVLDEVIRHNRPATTG